MRDGFKSFISCFLAIFALEVLRVNWARASQRFHNT